MLAIPVVPAQAHLGTVENCSQCQMGLVSEGWEGFGGKLYTLFYDRIFIKSYAHMIATFTTPLAHPHNDTTFQQGLK